VVWNLVVHEQRKLLFIETRNEPQVRFSAFNLSENRFLWKNLAFDEPWWITMTDAVENLLLFTVFTDKNNPGQKSLMAFDFDRKQIEWWKNNFSLSEVTTQFVTGLDTTLGMKTSWLDLKTGQPVKEQPDLPPVRNFSVLKPLQYYPGSEHFNTVKTFLEAKFRIFPVSLIEYMEYESLLFISCYVDDHGLANFLYVLNAEGEMLFTEKIDEGLKGIGIDTFFIFSGYVIFVKNKTLLVSYKLV
jgi:hypothetical protein